MPHQTKTNSGAAAEQPVFGAPPPPDRRQVLDWFIAYARGECERGVPPHTMTRHILGLFQGPPGAPDFKPIQSS